MREGYSIYAKENHAKAVQQIIDSGTSFALFRLPDTCTPVLYLQETDAKTLTDSDNTLDGFVFIPFKANANKPELLITPTCIAKGWDEITAVAETLPHKRCTLNKLKANATATSPITKDANYAKIFSRFHNKIKQGDIEKIVLSRCVSGQKHLLGIEGTTFVSAEEEFPHCMVSLIYSPLCGRWLGATPELLLRKNGDEWSTMALAGTKSPQEQSWSEKNKKEQQVVQDYIAQSLQSINASYKASSPYTSAAGHIEHIRTDFQFTISAKYNTMDLIRMLHPTPAVCGMPKSLAYDFINKHERQNRLYFSGVLGPVNIDEGTHLFVNLRCCHIRRNETLFFAGGGLNALSQMQDEAEELDRKLNTIMGLATSL